MEKSETFTEFKTTLVIARNIKITFLPAALVKNQHKMHNLRGFTCKRDVTLANPECKICHSFAYKYLSWWVLLQIFLSLWNGIRGHLVFVLSVCLSVCLWLCYSDSVAKKTFNLGHNFWNVRDRDFIFGMHTQLMNWTLSNDTKVNDLVTLTVTFILKILYTALNSRSLIFALWRSETDSPSLEFAHSLIFLHNPL